MARFNGKDINGAVGPVIFYTVNGKQYMRAKPGPQPRRRKKSAKSVATTAIFGLVSTCSAAMAGDMREHFLFPFRLATYNTLRGWMRNQYAFYHQSAEWKLVAKGADMCQVNPEASLAEHLRTGMGVTDAGNGKIIVAVEALNPVNDLKAPKGTTAVNIKLVAVAMAFEKNNRETKPAMEQYLFDYANQTIPQKELVLSTGGKAGDIAIVVVALEYNTRQFKNKGYDEGLRNLPLAVIAMGRLTA